MSARLQGKRALVTGSTSNIGRAIAETFAAEGAHVIVSGRDAARGAQVVAGIRAAGGRADFVQAHAWPCRWVRSTPPPRARWRH